MLNVFLLVVVKVAKFARAIVMSCAISVNADVYSIEAPLISTFAAYARVPELARSSHTYLKNLNVIHVLSGTYLCRHYLHLRG